MTRTSGPRCGAKRHGTDATCTLSARRGPALAVGARSYRRGGAGARGERLGPSQIPASFPPLRPFCPFQFSVPGPIGRLRLAGLVVITLQAC